MASKIKTTPKPVCVTGSKPKTLEKYLADNTDFTVCKCQLHISPFTVFGSSGDVCRSQIGKNNVLQAAAYGEHRMCHAEPATRKKDLEFAKALLAGGLEEQLSLNAPTVFVKNFSTSPADIKDFGTGYCYLKPLYNSLYWRVARVFGPGITVDDCIKLYSACGKKSFKNLSLVKIQGGEFYHIENTPGSSGIDNDAGKKLLNQLLAASSSGNGHWRIGFRIEDYQCKNLSFLVSSFQEDIKSGRLQTGKPRRSVVRKQVLPPFKKGLVLTNRFNLPEVSLDDDHLPIKPFNPVRRERKTAVKVKNQAFVVWSNRCLQKKMSLKNAHWVKGKFPERTPSALKFLKCAYGSIFISEDRFRQISEAICLTTSCPSSGFRVNHNGTFVEISHVQHFSGVSYCLGGEEFLHGGNSPNALKFQKIMWKAIALKSLRQAQENGIVIGKKAISSAQCNIVATAPGVFKKMIGYKIGAKVEGCTIYARGTDFSRIDDRPGQDGFLTVRQQELFWGNNQDFVFTMKGLSKVFFRKGQDGMWRHFIARALNMTLDAATIHLSRVENDIEVPDVVPRILHSTVVEPRIKIIEKPVYVEIPTIRDLPARVEALEVTPARHMADGNQFLLAPGMEGKSNRAVFVSAFPTDWQNRVSDPAYKAINTDLTIANRPTRRKGDLIVDPDHKFDLSTVRPTTPVKQEASRSNILDSLKTSPLIKRGPDSAAKIRELESNMRRKWQLRGLAGRVLSSPPDEFKLSRNADVSDIETNPGPEAYITPDEDIITVTNPTPEQYRKSTYKHHRRAASDMMHSKNRISYVSDNTDSPIDSDIMFVTGPTPITPIVPAKHFALPRSSVNADIEVNPGPKNEEERGRSKEVDETKVPIQLRSRSRSAIDRFSRVFNIDVKSDLELMKKTLGIDSETNFSIYHGSGNTWLGSCYQTHHVIGNFPSGKSWKIYTPGWSDSGALNACQRSLDSLFWSNEPFQYKKCGELMKMITTFFEKTELNERFDFRSVSAFAHIFKTTYGCPTDGNAYAVEFNAEHKSIIFHYHSNPKSDIKNKIIWCINDSKLFHGGDSSTRRSSVSSNTSASRKPELIGVGSSGDTLLEYEFSYEDKNADLNDRFQIASLQKSLQKIRYATDWGNHSLREENFAFMNSLLDDFDMQRLAAVAHWIKSSWGCPLYGLYHIDIRFNQNVIRVTRDDHRMSPGICWILVDGMKTVHLGQPQNKQEIWEEALRTFPDTSESVYSEFEYFCEDFKPEIGKFAKEFNMTGEEYTSYLTDTFTTPAEPGVLVWITYFYLRVYYFFTYYRNAYVEAMWPEVHDHSQSQEPEDPSQSLLIAKYGTRGDQVPIDYFANVAKEFGVPTIVKSFNDMTSKDLESLRKGSFLEFLPKQIDMVMASEAGYKKVFAPHIELANQQGHTYCLDPGPRYVNETKFVDDWSKVSLINYPIALAATVTTSVIRHSWRIGALRNCQLPRSLDGRTLLKKKNNLATFPEGWTSGSADISVIPLEIRNRCPEIPRGDHQELFRHYALIHCHGGAGTVQTAVSCGAKVVVHDPTLDRDYHTMPTSDDFHQPSVAPFLGWLIFSGFDVKAPGWIRIIYLLSYIWSIKWSVLYQTVHALAKMYAIQRYIRNHWVAMLIVYFAIPSIWQRVMYKINLTSMTIKTCAGWLWNFPLFCLIQNGFYPIATIWVISRVGRSLMFDYAAYKNNRTFLVYEPVERQGLKFPFPFGHWCIYDSETGDLYEGSFRTNKPTLGQSFQLRTLKRSLKEGHKKIPIPFNSIVAKNMLRIEEKEDFHASYGSDHNCVTYTFRLVWKNSFIGSVLLLAVAAAVFIALSPPGFLKKVLNLLYPGVDITKTPLYMKLGFAAGIEGIPFENEDVEEAPVSPATSGTTEQYDVDFSDPKSFESLVAEIAKITNLTRLSDVKTLDDDDLQEVAEKMFLREIDKVKYPEDSMILEKSIPPYVRYTWAQLVDRIHLSISFVKNTRFTEMLVNWLISIERKIYDFLFPILECFSYVLGLAWNHSKDSFIHLFTSICHLLDHVWGLEASTRIKTVWGLTGLYRTGMLSAKARIASNIAYSEFIGRTNFESDYNRLVQEGREMAKRYKAIDKGKLGGPQRRPIGYGTPLMSRSEAEVMGFTEGEFATDGTYEERVNSYLAQGIRQGGDGVLLADRMPELIAKSQHRYEPRYPELDSDKRAESLEVAQALFEQYPQVFANCDVLPHGAVYNYLKKKYSPGTPFIRAGGFKSRQAMFDAGYDKVIRRKAMEYMETGKYPNQFYHAFVKSQVVDIRKCLPFSKGGVEKDVRTVVSQDLWSYFIDQTVQIERNKRPVWDTYGSGAGMPLNQSMAFVYDKIQQEQKERGGRYIIMDGKAFDSACMPQLFQVSADLWSLGYKDHPSGNGANIASIPKASYDARQNSWIIGITEPEYKSLTVCVPDKETRKLVESQNHENLLPLASLIDWAHFNTLNQEEKLDYVSKIDPPANKTLVTWDPKYRPKVSNWMGLYKFGDIATANQEFQQHQSFIYDKSNFEALNADIRAVSNSNYALMSNVHYKNRGGSTGGSDTSNVNTVTFKAGVIIAWMRTTGRPAKDFFKYNTLFNTSDDTVWQSGGSFGLNTIKDVETFRQHAADVGIHLEIETTKDITKVEYLSKFVRTPTADDSEVLKAWRKYRIETIQQSHRARGFEVPVDFDHLNNPKFVVVQNPAAILLRRSAFRYYQSSPLKWRFTSIERGSGHALNTAFVPDLWEQFGLEWCDDANTLFERFKIHRKYAIKNGKYGLQEIVQIDPRASQQSLSPRQKAFISWLKGNMFPNYLRVIDIHMDVKKIDPEKHSKFLRKLERGWRGWDEIMKEGVDNLFSMTNAIPDEWSKKFQPGVDMLYAEQPFYTFNMNTERFVYLKLLDKKKEEDITFGEFSSKINESPYAAACNPFRFWEKVQQKEYREQLHQEETIKIQGLVFLISALYMLTSAAESILLTIPIVGVFYKLFLWSFIGLNKVYGVLNTMYWHSTGESSREISRISPRDPYMITKQFCVFIVDLFPDWVGYIMMAPVLLLELLPPCLDAIGKTWWKGTELKNVVKLEKKFENPWDAYAPDYIDALRNNKINAAYVAAKTSTGKSTMFIAALWAQRHRKNIRKIWLIEPRRLLRDETVIPFDIPFQRLERGKTLSPSTDIYICTYGHFLYARNHDVDVKNDIVLFDEFHEEQGEMILAIEQVKAPKFLLSATPVEIPALRGADFLEPGIDRRHPITIHRFEKDMSVVEATQMAANAYPHLMDRALIIVPTIRELDRTMASLEYLKLGHKITKVYSGQKVIPKEGIILATPYIQTGADIKPAAKILIDCGRDVVIDKGVLVKPFPYTSKDVHQQRIGRVGRLEPGVVYTPELAGTGVKGVLYPSPNLFMHKCVADHFKVPQLTPSPTAVSHHLPFMSLNVNKLSSTHSQKSVTMIHAISLAGIRETDWEKYYTWLRQGKYLGEDFDFIQRIMAIPRWAHTPLLDWNTANYFLSMERTVKYSFNNVEKWTMPVKPINGRWEEMRQSPSNNITVITEDGSKEEAKFVRYAKAVTNIKSALLSQARAISESQFLKTYAILGDVS